MQIIRYPHPTLRRVSRPLKRVDAELHRIVREMLEVMYAEKGVGLAANQVNLPYRLFVMNPTGDAQARDEELVFINPVLSQFKGSDEAQEGCLSLPKIWADVRRPVQVRINAYNLMGNEVDFTWTDFRSRVAQHEADHLDGVLFVDRLSATAKSDVREAMSQLESEFVSQRGRGEIPPDDQIALQLAELEALRT